LGENATALTLLTCPQLPHRPGTRRQVGLPAPPVVKAREELIIDRQF
jgi:hypothetical protein